MQEVDNVLRIFKETRRAIFEKDSRKINRLSDQTIHTATVYQDPDNIIVAVFIYALSKIVEREHYEKMVGWEEFNKNLIKNLDIAIKYLESKDIKKFRIILGRIRNSINKISSNLRIYIQDVFRKAELNKALKLYAHGLSSEKTAQLLGVSLWDLSGYIGQSHMSEVKKDMGLPVGKRIKIAEEMFT